MIIEDKINFGITNVIQQPDQDIDDIVAFLNSNSRNSLKRYYAVIDLSYLYMI